MGEPPGTTQNQPSLAHPNGRRSSWPLQAVTCDGLLLQIMRIVQVKPVIEQAPLERGHPCKTIDVEGTIVPTFHQLVDKKHNLPFEADRPTAGFLPCSVFIVSPHYSELGGCSTLR
jgi:hypothetical protein